MGQNVLFNKTLDFTPYTEDAQAVLNTIDGGFLVCNSFNDSISSIGDEIKCIKMDRYGCIEWHKNFDQQGPTVSKSIKDLTQLEDGSYVFLGRHKFLGESNDVDLWKTDASGNLLWHHSYGGEHNERPTKLFTLEEGGFLIGGIVDIGGETSPHYLVRTDSEGNILWEYEHPNIEVSGIIANIQKKGDNFLLLVNHSEIEEIHTSLYEISPDGILLNQIPLIFFFESSIPGQIQEDVTSQSFIQLEDGNYIITGFISLFNTNRLVVGKVNYEGEIIWEHFGPYYSYDFPIGIFEMEDGSFLVGGQRYAGNNPVDVSWLAKFSPEGELLWRNDLTSPNPGGITPVVNRFWDMDQAPDGTILIGGRTDQEPAGGLTSYNAMNWILKVDADGNFVAPLEGELTSEEAFLFLGKNTSIQLDISSTTGCYNYEWSGNGGAFITEDSLGNWTFNANSVGVYEVLCTISDEAGQVIERGIEITVEEDTNLETIASQKIKVYPNPAQDVVYFQFPSIEKPRALKIYNSIGKLIRQVDIPVYSNEVFIKLIDWSSGIYFWELEGYNSKFMKE